MADSTYKKEIVSGISQAKCAFNKKKNLFTYKSIDILTLERNSLKHTCEV
jgi:hypothetical protein